MASPRDVSRVESRATLHTPRETGESKDADAGAGKWNAVFVFVLCSRRLVSSEQICEPSLVSKLCASEVDP